MRVLFLAPPWGEVYGRFRSITRSLNLNAPLNLGSLAASAQAAGHAVEIRDLEFEPRGEARLRAIIEHGRPDVVGLTVTSPLTGVVARLAAVARSAGKTVVIGGPHVTLVRGPVFEQIPDAHYALFGEGEQTFTRFLNRLDAGVAPDDIPGLLRPDAPVTEHVSPPVVRHLDDLPDPIYPGIDFNRYLWSVKGRSRVPTQTIMSSRGCPYQCVFCSIENLTGREVRWRDPERVAAEMERSIRERPVRHFVFVDDVMTLNRRRVRTLCETLIRRGLPATWEADTRADAVDENLLSLMARAGCTRVNFGIESGDETVLDGLNKRLALPRVIEALRLAKKAGMDTRGTAMIGNPGDTRESIERTVRFLRDLRDLDQPYLSIAQPYPGTRLRETALRGDSNLRIAVDRLDEMRRYGSSVMEVGDIGPREMERLQRRSLLRFYLRPRRIWYNLTRAHPLDGLRLSFGLLQGVMAPSR